MTRALLEQALGWLARAHVEYTRNASAIQRQRRAMQEPANVAHRRRVAERMRIRQREEELEDELAARFDAEGERRALRARGLRAVVADEAAFVFLVEPCGREVANELSIALAVDDDDRMVDCRIVEGTAKHVAVDFDAIEAWLRSIGAKRFWHAHTHHDDPEPSGIDRGLHARMAERFGDRLAGNIIIVCVDEDDDREPWRVRCYSHARGKRFSVRADPETVFDDGDQEDE
jgi:hypothetical protein